MDEDDQQLGELELGSSYFELIEFSLTRRVRGKDVQGRYGVNVAKVREVVRMPKINPLASGIKGLAGVFELRGVPIPAVHLAAALGDADAEPQPGQQIIVTEFSLKRAGFIVNATHRIRRVAWDKVLPPTSDASTCISGMTILDDGEFLFILDLERILINLEFGEGGAPIAENADLAPRAPRPSARGPASAARHDAPSAAAGGDTRILLVDDSAFIRVGVRQALSRAGYVVVEAGDGVEALALLEQGEQTGSRFDLVVSDVEMPRMDGLTFVRKVRAHPTLNRTPILLHTSLSGRNNQDAGAAAGANGYVVKNDLATLFDMIKELLGPSFAARPA
jgi:two-component system chemotaxis response regulator CheV